ncbi:MAG: D-glycero-beta-D-manno-heptose-7-phosphate kinase [Deltaproteobacteria bacterium]|nr:D-glycero-beta-D-manno-heptose-7-phosphate kinase [Deltaproteobacteria bacterium]
MLPSLGRILPLEQRQRVLVVGDLILDEYLRGTVQRISPEAPVPVLEAAETHCAPGGAANVAANLASLGAAVVLCGAVGADGNGRRLVELLAARGIDTRGVVTDELRPTTHKLRVVAHSQHVLRIDQEERQTLGGDVETRLLKVVQEQIGSVAGVVLSDYAKGVLNPTFVADVIKTAAAAGVAVTVDPKGTDYVRYRGARVLTPNLSELQHGTGLPVGTEAERRRAAAALLESTQVPAVLVTCGKDGMVLYEAGREPVRIAAQAREVFDVTGAGDTVIAVLSLALFAGLSLEDAARVANVGAGIVVGKLGTASVSREELQAALGAASVGSATKVVELATAARAANDARAASRRVVFTNGCFDLLHAGHVTYLEAARAHGDLLIVAVNSDASVRRLKGPGRPLVAAEHRAKVVAGMASVDLVVVFDADTPDAVIRAIRPDVLVKGADYRLEDVVGRDVVEAHGGRVELVPLVDGCSTSKLIAAINRSARHGPS